MGTAWVSNILVFIKQPLPYLLSFSLVFGLLIFGPRWITMDLGINQVVSQYRWALGIGFIIIVMAIIAVVLSVAGEYITGYVANKFWLRKHVKRLHDLTPQEKRILRSFIENDTRSCLLNVTDGIVGGLVTEKIIYRSASVSRTGTLFSHNIQPWVWDYLRKNTQLLD